MADPYMGQIMHMVVWFADDENSVQEHELLPYIGKNHAVPF